MKANFARCLAHVLVHEGGWADHPSDPGGATMKGITIGTYRDWKGRAVTKAELRAIPDSEVEAIYRRNYWDAVRGDDLPSGLDLVAFDAAVNSGVSRGARWLQQALGVTADGKIGSQTISAANAAHPVAVIDRACDIRLAFLRGLKTWPTFGRGWGRRVEGARETANAMAVAPAAKPTPEPDRSRIGARPEPDRSQTGARPEPVKSATPIIILAIGAAIAAALIL